MDYASQLNTFQNSYDEQVSAFNMKKSDIVTGAQSEEKKGEDTEAIGLPVAGIALKAVGKEAVSVAKTTVSNLADKAVEGVKSVAQDAVPSLTSADAPSVALPFSINSVEDGSYATLASMAETGGAAAAEGATGATAALAGAEAGIGTALAATVGAAVPIIGGIVALIEGIHAIHKGHQELANRPQFQMPAAETMALPTYKPGLASS